MHHHRRFINCAILFLTILHAIGDVAAESDVEIDSKTSAGSGPNKQKLSGIKAVKKYLQDRGIEMQDIPKAILIYEGLSMCFM